MDIQELIEWLEERIKACETNAKVFSNAEMAHAAIGAEAMAVAYKNVLLKVRK